MKKLLLCGAGKIGRSFIGQLFSLGGYTVTFVDISREIVDQLNRRGAYDVVIRSDSGNRILTVKRVRGLHFSETEKIYQEIGNTDLFATAVGPGNLPGVMDMIGTGLEKRFGNERASSVDIIIAENLRNAADYFTEHLKKHLPGDTIRNRIGLIETSIGKMVPIMTDEEIKQDILRVYAEPYNTLILDGLAFKNPLPEVKGLAPKNNMKAWVDRKLFIHNLGHATAAYLGYRKHPDAVYMHEVLSDPGVLEQTRMTMFQSAEILREMYPEVFSESDLTNHIDDLLARFRNKALGDTVFRVGCDLFRKLGPEDRLVAPLKAAMELNKSHDRILDAIRAAISFRGKDENGHYFPADEQFFRLSEKGLEHVLREVCKIEINL